MLDGHGVGGNEEKDGYILDEVAVSWRVDDGEGILLRLSTKTTNNQRLSPSIFFIQVS